MSEEPKEFTMPNSERMSELELQALDKSIVDALEGTTVHVRGSILGDEFTHDLARRGVQDILNACRRAGYKIVRED